MEMPLPFSNALGLPRGQRSSVALALGVAAAATMTVLLWRNGLGVPNAVASPPVGVVDIEAVQSAPSEEAVPGPASASLVDPKGRALVDPKGRALVDPKGRLLVDANGRLLVDANGRLRVDPQGEALDDPSVRDAGP